MAKSTKAPKSVAVKLRLQAGMRALVWRAPKNLGALLEPLPAGVTLDDEPVTEPGAYAFVQIYLRNQAEMAEYGPLAAQAVAPDGLLWLCYPKKSGSIASNLARDLFWTALEAQGLAPVTQIALDADWSALRFRPADKIGR